MKNQTISKNKNPMFNLSPIDNTNYLWKKLMVASAILLLSKIPNLGHTYASFYFDSHLVVLGIISFILFFGRIYLGDSYFSIILENIGVNTIFHSENILLRHKRFIDSFILTIQGGGFIFLAYYINCPYCYFKSFFLLITINLLWLIYQVFCLSTYLRCIKKKCDNKLKGYDKNFFLQKYSKIDKLNTITNKWLLNNVIFSLIALLCFNHYNIDAELALNIGIISTITNSILDYTLTGMFYTIPENSLFDKL